GSTGDLPVPCPQPRFARRRRPVGGARMTDRSGRPQGSPPPSFSPPGAGASRPSSDDGAVPVGGANGPVTHVPARPTRRPTTGGTPRATRSGEPAARPASVPPRATSSGRPSAEGARPAG